MSFQSDMQALVADQIAMGEGEWIVYEPYQAAPRSIPAVIDRREPFTEFAGGGSVPVIRYLLTVSTDPVLGVAVPQVGKDTCEVKVHRADLTATTFRVARLIHADSGGLTLEIVK